MHIFILQHVSKYSSYDIAIEQLGIKITGKNTLQMAINYHTGPALLHSERLTKILRQD